MDRPPHRPHEEPPSGADGPEVPGVECPFCDRFDTELISPFGGQLSVAQYWCRRCRTGFDYVKWEEHGPR